jgi:hypothetical protein
VHLAVRQAGQLPGGGAPAGHVLAAASTAGALPSSSRKAPASASRAAATPSVLLSMSFLPEAIMVTLAQMLQSATFNCQHNTVALLMPLLSIQENCIRT